MPQLIYSWPSSLFLTRVLYALRYTLCNVPVRHILVSANKCQSTYFICLSCFNYITSLQYSARVACKQTQTSLARNKQKYTFKPPATAVHSKAVILLFLFIHVFTPIGHLGLVLGHQISLITHFLLYVAMRFRTNCVDTH